MAGPVARSVAGFVLAAAVLLVLVWMRAGRESTLWIDEIHSLQLTQLSVSRLLDETARDFHPPGYVLALKVWIRAGREAGFDPGTPWARALNVIVWLLAAGWTWFMGGRALGRASGAILAATVAGSAAAAVAVRDLRGYGFAFACLVVAVVTLAGLVEERRPRWRVLLWTVYGGALSAALWSHLLAAPAVALLSASWLVLAMRRRRGDAGWRIGAGLAAHLLPWLLFLPWLVRVPGQVARLHRAAPDWMTPATAENLLRVFTWWLPLGRISPPTPGAEPWLVLLGGAAVALPLTAGAVALVRHRMRGPAATLAALALPAAIGSILVYWLLARFGLAATFHGPRYPVLVGGLLAAGLAGAALAGTRRPALAAAILAPWWVAALAGQLLALREESVPGGLAAFRPQVVELAAAAGGERVLYVTPSELAPFVRRTFSGFTLRGVEEMVCSGSSGAVLLDVNPWPDLERTRDRVLARALASGRLAATVEQREWRDLQTTATAYRLAGIDREMAAELCRRGVQPRSAVPADASSTALPGDQLAGDGWSYLELGPDLDASRWATRPVVLLRFDRRVPAGDYLLHLTGVRHPYPEETVTMTLELEGGALRTETAVPQGPFHLVLPVTLGRSRRPRLVVHHPVWSPAVAMGTGDRRQLAFLLDAGWLSPRGQPAGR